MLCPHCHHQDHLEIDMHSDGFSSGTLLECSVCGALLSLDREILATLNQPEIRQKGEAAARHR